MLQNLINYIKNTTAKYFAVKESEADTLKEEIATKTNSKTPKRLKNTQQKKDKKQDYLFITEINYIQKMKGRNYG